MGKVSPWATGRPIACTSLMKVRKVSMRCLPPASPNSCACLIRLTRSPPALARPTTSALDDCACTRKEAKSRAPSGWRVLPMTWPPALCTKRVALLSRDLPKT
ncbi:hypothetical protein D3C72_1701160 [compost metagenome]